VIDKAAGRSHCPDFHVAASAVQNAVGFQALFHNRLLWLKKSSKLKTTKKYHPCPDF